MPLFVKKPIIVEATQWFENGDHPNDNCEDPLKNEGEVVRYYRTPYEKGSKRCRYCGKFMHVHGWIDTAQGGHTVCPGDWIITDDRVEIDQHGHYYPCKPDIFEATYDPYKEETC